MAWHSTREGGTTQKCVKYPDQVGFSTVLVGGFSVTLSHQARNDWMEYVNSLTEYREYRNAEQKLLSIQYQQNGNPSDLSWGVVARERSLQSSERVMFNIARAWSTSSV